MLLELVKKKVAHVECVIKSRTKQLVKIANHKHLAITPFHPVKTSEGWIYPVQLGAIEHVAETPVYNFVLSPRNSTLVINGLECSVLAHGITGAPILEHPHGSTNFALELARNPGYEKGEVVLEEPIC